MDVLIGTTNTHQLPNSVADPSHRCRAIRAKLSRAQRLRLVSARDHLVAASRVPAGGGN